MKSLGRLIFVLGVLVGLAGCGDQGQPRAQPPDAPPTQSGTYEKVRGMAVAGLFYPRHQKDLAKAVDAALEDVKPEAIQNLRGLVCPHAGYEFSAKTAAFGYKLLKGREIDTAIVMAPSHYAAFKGASIPYVDAYETPLGMIPLSPKARELAKLEPFVVNPTCDVQRPGWWKVAPKELPPFGEDTPHSWEHSLEVQLPFLQRTLEDFRLVPIVFGQQADPEVAARALEKFLDDKTILIASSDLSHFHPYETAKRLDTACVSAICNLKIAWMEQQEACGKVPILTLMHVARKKGWKTKKLDYRNSGDVTGKMEGVVGYAAIAFYEPAGAAAVEKTSGQPGQDRFTPEQRKFLLELARKTVDGIVKDRSSPQLDADDVPEEFAEPRGCFVTLKKAGQLRGCIGSIFPQEPLYQAVLHQAENAAIRDPRFPPVKPDELNQIEVEVSVLTVPERLEFKSPEDLLDKLRPNIDGVVLRVDGKGATYLPQVWEDLPKKEEFLSRLAQKAGLAPDAWKSPRATILVYQADAFKESEM